MMRIPPSVMELPLVGFAKARSAGYALEGRFLNLLSKAIPGVHSVPAPDKATAAIVQAELMELLERDSRNIGRGLYPASVLTPESPLEHLKRIPKVLFDGIQVSRRRNRGRTTEFKDREAKELLGDLPRYYRRNFHFQSDGYLSRRSAELYEHQVELLFGGSADAMRRLILPAMRQRFGDGKGDGLRFLEIGAGTGRATRFVSLAFPRAKIVAVDLSAPYLKHAQEKLRDRATVDFLQGDGAHLPFKDAEFDAVFSVFLFHELPHEEREAVLRESARVLKPGGFAGYVDSIQLGDQPVFDSLLHEFPQAYHEPFYRDYLGQPMDRLLGEAGFTELGTDRGFFSKAGWGARN